MCGFGMDMIFKVAIFIIVVLAIFAILRWAFPTLFNFAASPYGPIIQIVVGAVVAIIILVIIWRLAECSGLIRGGGLDVIRLAGA